MGTISYYELLEMIKNDIIPKVVNYKITGYIENYIEYTAQYDRDTFTHYEITNRNRVDENIHFFLNENYLESDMFDKSILIIEDTPKEVQKIEKIDISKFPKRNNSLKKIALKVNEIIELLNNSVLLSEKEVGKFLDKVNGEDNE